MVSFIWGLFHLLYARGLSKVNVNKWTFGQIVPVLLLLAPLVQVMEHIFPADEDIHHTTRRQSEALQKPASLSSITVAGLDQGGRSQSEKEKKDNKTGKEEAEAGPYLLNSHTPQTTNTLTLMASSLEAQTNSTSQTSRYAHDCVKQDFKHSRQVKDTLIFLVLIIIYLGVTLMVLVSRTNNVLFVQFGALGATVPVFWSGIHIILGVWQFLCLRIMLEDFAFSDRPGRGVLVKAKWAILLRFSFGFFSLAWFLIAEFFFFFIWCLVWLAPTGVYFILVCVRLVFRAMKLGIQR